MPIYAFECAACGHAFDRLQAETCLRHTLRR